MFDDVNDQRVPIAALLLVLLLGLGEVAPVKPSMTWAPSPDQDEIDNRHTKNSQELGSNEPAFLAAQLGGNLSLVRIVPFFLPEPIV
jgi:hypothetical protein